MKIAVLGDLHLSRSLPHRRTTIDGTNDRYAFRISLLQKAIEKYETAILLGDVTDTPDLIDGRLMRDFVSVIGNKRRIVHVLGNHDRHDNTGDISMGEILSRCMDNYQCYSEVKTVSVDKVCFVFAPYYAVEGLIMDHVEAAAKKHNNVLVLGHWNFFDEVYGGKLFKESWLVAMAQAGVRFFLGHLHTPGDIIVEGRTIGSYLGAVSPVRFKEKQGRIMVVDTEKPSLSFERYPMGEEFIEFRYGGDMPDFMYQGNENKYFKVYYDGKKYHREGLREQLEEDLSGYRSLILVEESEEIDRHKEELRRNEEETEESYLLSVAQEQGFKNHELLIKTHQEIKGGQ